MYYYLISTYGFEICLFQVLGDKMKRIIIKMICFILPFVVFFLPFMIVALLTMEIVDFNQVMNIQRLSKREILVGMGYNEQTDYYKLSNMNYFEPEVIALGTSRVMQFKGDYFVREFYNVGGAVNNNFDEYKNFLENVKPSAMPELIILGLDSWVFNDSWNQSVSSADCYWEIEKYKPDVRSTLFSIIEDYMDGKWSFSQVIDSQNSNLGFNGQLREDGFLVDGSYYYGDFYRNPKLQKDYLFADTYDRIENGIQRFEYGNVVDAETLCELEDLLAYCRQHSIQVVAFIPPFAPSVYDKLQNSGHYGYMENIYSKCLPLFTKYGFEVYDVQNSRALGCSDEYFVDGFHGGDIVYGKIIQYMISENSIIKEFTDEVKLNSMIENSYSPTVFEIINFADENEK